MLFIILTFVYFVPLWLKTFLQWSHKFDFSAISSFHGGVTT